MKLARLRVRIPIVLATFLITMCGGPHPVYAESFSAPQLNIIAETSTWSTELLITSRTGAVVNYSNCSMSTRPATLKPYGTVKIATGGECYFGIGAAALASDDADVVSVLSFNDGVSRAQFPVPTLTRYLGGNDAGELPRIVNDGDTRTFIVLLNAAERTATVNLEIRDGDNDAVSVESVTVPRGVFFYPLITPVRAGRIVVTQGALSVGYSGASTGVIYSFAVVGPADGGTQRVEVMR